MTVTARPEAAATGDTAAAPAIRTRALVKRYASGALAVDGIDLEVPRGELFGLLGPNGAGKTTTVGMLTTRIVLTAGDAWVSGFDVRRRPVDVKRRIGVVTQMNTLDRRLTAWENLFYHGRYFGLSAGDAHAEANRILDLIRLQDRAKSFVDQLSGGMQQRLLIGRALVHAPEVLFLDEPTAGIDPQSRIALWELLQQLNRSGQTILLTTHYMEEADRLCDRVAIMDHGRILALGTPDELKRSLGMRAIYTLRVDSAPESLTHAIAGRPGVQSVEPALDGLIVYADAVEGLLPRIVEDTVAAGVHLRDLSVSEPTLETVFLRLTGRELRD